jgi:RNA polymerase sigma-70 factor (ECF subfamily)
VESFDRKRLFGIAYRMLGSVADADDAVQEAWLRWQAVDRASIENPSGYLAQIVTREALQLLRRRRARRESYVGPWLPEPVLWEDDFAESVSMAMLIVLETLSPLERAVFVLREAFGYEHAEIAKFLGRSDAAVRQLAHRAREHVAACRPRFEADRGEHSELTERFARAAGEGDLDALLELLAPDVTIVVDRGGHGPAPRGPVQGAERVVKFLQYLSERYAGAKVRLVDVNGVPGFLTSVDGQITSATVLDLHQGRVQAIHVVANPEKLSGVARSIGADVPVRRPGSSGRREARRRRLRP